MAGEGQDNAPKIIRASDLVTFYVNGARIVQSEYDVRIYFSEQVPPGPSEPSAQSTSVEKVCVIMAPKFVGDFVRLFHEMHEGVAGEEVGI